MELLRLSRPALVLLMGILPLAAQSASSVRVDKPEGALLGKVIVTLDSGEERTVSEKGILAWVMMNGRAVLYTSNEGAKGFENEGQSLHVHVVKTGETRRLASEALQIIDLQETRTDSGPRARTAFIASMKDGGVGIPYVAVISPRKGVVLRQKFATIKKLEQDSLVLNRYYLADVQRADGNMEKVTPASSESLRVSGLLMLPELRDNQNEPPPPKEPKKAPVR